MLSDLAEEELKEHSKWIMLANKVAPMFNTIVEEAFGFGDDVNDEHMIVFAMWFYEKKGKKGKQTRRREKKLISKLKLTAHEK